MPSNDAIAVVELGGIKYRAREHKYQATVLRLSDRFEVTIPAPDGKVLGADGYRAPVLDVAKMGDPVTLYMSDPAVQGGREIQKFTGRVVGREVRTDESGGTVMRVAGSDLGWHLSSCARVFMSLRGLTWLKMAERLLGLTVNPATGIVTQDRYSWGFQGVGSSNILSRKVKLGRQAAEQDFQQRAVQHGSLLVPRIQCEVGQTLDQLLIQYARIAYHLVNVSADGWLQIFRPGWDGKTLDSDGFQKPYTAAPEYEFIHPGNILANTLSLQDSADQLFSHVECWNTVIDRTNQDDTNQNWGNYHGTFDVDRDAPVGTRPFAFDRFYTFSDPQQYGQQDGTSKVKKRSEWQFKRFAFDARRISFEVQGHSQNGVPYVEDTCAHFKSDLLGLDALYYVSSVEPYRKLARPGMDMTAGTRTKITLQPWGVLGA